MEEKKEKVVEEKKEEIPKEETPPAAEPTKEEAKEPTIADVVNDIYTQLETMRRELEALKLNQIWIQQYVTNALKSTEVKE